MIVDLIRSLPVVLFIAAGPQAEKEAFIKCPRLMFIFMVWGAQLQVDCVASAAKRKSLCFIQFESGATACEIFLAQLRCHVMPEGEYVLVSYKDGRHQERPYQMHLPIVTLSFRQGL